MRRLWKDRVSNGQSSLEPESRFSLLDIINGVCGVSGGLVLCGVTNQSLLVGESDIGWGDTVS